VLFNRSVIREAMVVKNMQSLFRVLEPLLRRVVTNIWASPFVNYATT
jgi:hypothetical protein